SSGDSFTVDIWLPLVRFFLTPGAILPNLPSVPVYLIRGSPQSLHSFPLFQSESPLLRMSVAYRNNGKGDYGPVCWEFEGINNHAVIYCSDEGCSQPFLNGRQD